MKPASHPAIPAQKEGVLIVNLGTPDDTSWLGVRRYLKEFLSDRRVIELHPLLWQPILNLIILTLRPHKSAHAYRSIWREETNESPLRYFTRIQGEKLAGALPQAHVRWAMRYGNPSMASQIEALCKEGCTRITLVPLYPQYCAATTATVCDETFRVLAKMRWQPSVRVVPPFHDHDGYIQALAQSVKDHVEPLNWRPQKLIASFHGMPADSLKKGDPYACMCAKTARLLRDALELTQDTFMHTFQSRFGPKEWLTPYTQNTLEALPSQGVTRIAVVAPGFVSDCLETLEEINMQYREIFLRAGGTHFTYVPCLNESDAFISLLSTLITGQEHLPGQLHQRVTAAHAS